MSTPVHPYAFAPAMREPQGSPIRELFPYMSLPGMISFAGGYPSPGSFDAGALQAAASAVMAADPAQCLQYGPTEGMAALRRELSALMAERGAPLPSEQIVVTSGSQQGFELLVKALVAPGTPVWVETPTYPAAVQALRLAGAAVRGIPSDRDGLCVESLAAMLAGCSEAERPRLLYLVPTFANPSGRTLALDRRRALLVLAARHRIVVVEDDPYGSLRFDGEPLPSLLSLAAQDAALAPWVIYLGSFSKTMAPGLRLGWMAGPAEILRRAVIAKQVSDLCTSPWLQLAMASCLADGLLARQTARIIALYRRKRDLMAQALADTFGAALRSEMPQGGMFLWCGIEGVDDAASLLPHAIAARVMYVPGASFGVDGAPSGALRLSFATASDEQIVEGVARLRQAVRASQA
ncbi:PLP-dependent aminotransferase family protein [Cupriavidus basilensis]|uniref:PLP-dependent aminotransferase family protein n=1 Tax=Cupriavidus basilensis TaxID=68895 RepID=A0ABT6AUS7_9BURK|nr:PLP-dependent aminotransferase family protein [Cupriavidus basilensis]MDF3836377.1 PLP-dependent aminotransferase family protein [Cupriavidus basilensis]